MRNIHKAMIAATTTVAALLAAPAAHSYASDAPAAAALTPTASGVSGGILFGGDQGLMHEAGNIGRKLGIVRVYDHIGNTFPLPGYDNIMAAGSTLLISLDSTTQSYTSIANGKYDNQILTFLKSVNASAIKYNLNAIYISFEHEPDNPKHTTFGTPAQFIQAWDHVHQLAASAGLDWNNGGRLHWVWIMIRTSFDNSYASQFWPGSNEVDVVGIDGYNSPGCSGNKPPATPADIFGPALAFASANGDMPVFISEWASTNDPSGGQAAFIASMQSYVTADPDIDAAMYWDTQDVTKTGAPGGCSYVINANPASVQAMYTLATSPQMQGYLN